MSPGAWSGSQSAMTPACRKGRGLSFIHPVVVQIYIKFTGATATTTTMQTLQFVYLSLFFGWYCGTATLILARQTDDIKI
jgi:hypothetical protein